MEPRTRALRRAAKILFAITIVLAVVALLSPLIVEVVFGTDVPYYWLLFPLVAAVGVLAWGLWVRSDPVYDHRAREADASEAE